MPVYWELEGNILNGDNVTLASGTKTHCKKVFRKLSEEQKNSFRNAAYHHIEKFFAEMEVA